MRRASKLWYLLLVPPFVGLLWPPFYATVNPKLFGFPFFYWYELAWVPLTALLTWIVYLATRSEGEDVVPEREEHAEPTAGGRQ